MIFTVHIGLVSTAFGWCRVCVCLMQDINLSPGHYDVTEKPVPKSPCKRVAITLSTLLHILVREHHTCFSISFLSPFLLNILNKCCDNTFIFKCCKTFTFLKVVDLFKYFRWILEQCFSTRQPGSTCEQWPYDNLKWFKIRLNKL